MKAVMSFWTKPSRTDGGAIWKGNAGFPNRYYFAVSFWLSFMLARQWFKRVEFVTDEQGAEFVRQLGIPFNRIDVCLNEIDHLRSDLWAYGKLKTYAMQTEPFVHFDYDAYFITKPERIMQSQVFAQNTEDIYAFYYADNIEFFTRNFEFLPKEWHTYRMNLHRKSFNVGIIGGQNHAALRDYAEKAMKIVTDNYNVIERIEDNGKVNNFNIVFEQYFLAAYMAHHGYTVDTLVRDNMPYTSAGFDHFVGGAKSDMVRCERIDNYLRKHFPEAWNRLNQIKTEL